MWSRGIGAAVLAMLAVGAAALPSAAFAKKHHRTPVAVAVEWHLTGQADYRKNVNGSSLTCPDSGAAPYNFDDRVRAHLAFDSVWHVKFDLSGENKPDQVSASRTRYNGSTWSLRGHTLSGEECVGPKPYNCSGSIRPAQHDFMVYAPNGDDTLRIVLFGPQSNGFIASPRSCNENGSHVSIKDEIPDEIYDQLFSGVEHGQLKKFVSTKHSKDYQRDLNFAKLDSDCGSDDSVTCRQSADGTIAFSFDRERVWYKK